MKFLTVNYFKNLLFFLPIILSPLYLIFCSSDNRIEDAVDIVDKIISDVQYDDIELSDIQNIDIDNRFVDSDKDGIPDRRELIIGTDPFDPDTDKDGVNDGDEYKGRTDPLNPASAKAWHPEINSHPRLFFDNVEGEQIKQHLKNRIGEKREPYYTIYERIRVKADMALLQYGEEFDVKISPELGEIAESAAFLGWLYDDGSYTKKAVDAICISFPDPTDVSSTAKYNLYESEALVSFCQAYEYVASSRGVGEEDLKVAKENLTKRLDYFREITHNGTYAVELAYLNNNHKIKVLGALGLCAMLLNDREQAAFEISSAMTGIDFLIGDFQNANGVYAEGWSYLNYTDNSLLPFMYAYHRFSKGREFPYYGVENISGGSPHSGKIVMIKDFVTNPLIQNIYKTALISTQPNGLMNPVDDANPECLHGAILYRIFEEPDFLWQWYKEACNFNTNRLNTLSLLLLTDDLAPDVPLDIPESYVDKEGGLALLRDGFEDSAIYLAFIGENNKARTNGLGHEHPDELSLILWAYKEPLIIDAGYINWENHDKTKYAKDHSVILIDGQGAQYNAVYNKIGADAFISDMISGNTIDYISGTTSYDGADIKRSIIRLRKRYFLLFDEILTNDSNNHIVSVQINGAGGGDIPDSYLLIEENKAEYKRGDVILKISVLTTGEEINLSSREEEYSKQWGEWGTNEMLIAEARCKESSYFVTLLIPQPETQAIYTESYKEGDFLIHYISDEESEYLAIFSNKDTNQSIIVKERTVTVEPGLNILHFESENETERVVIKRNSY